MPDGEQRLSRRAATRLRDELTAALAGREEFLHTAGEQRPDGSYVVSRRNAESAGHAKRFRDLRAIERLYERLPERFDAEAVGEAAEEAARSAEGDGRLALSGSRRHLVLRHLAEHPGFDCELVSRQPLTARKTPTEGGPPDQTEPTAAEPELTPTD